MVLQGKQCWKLSGALSWATISEMELLAAIHALRLLPSSTQVHLYSDSEWLIRGMRHFASQWQEHGWKNRRGRLVPHRELWEELMCFDLSLHIRWQWIRGHSGHPIQSEADRLAYQAARARWFELQMAA